MKNHIITYTGKCFDLLYPKPEMVCIEDIAHSLAYQCRYTGHTRKFYSVAQHCVLMVMNDDMPGDPLAKLLHDAGETYIGDIARPWKALLDVCISENGTTNSYHFSVREFEHKIQRVIGLALGINLEHSAEVKESDIRTMATEVRDLMPPGFSAEEWGIDISNPAKEKIIPWLPNAAEEIFLAVYKMLKLERIKI